MASFENPGQRPKTSPETKATKSEKSRSAFMNWRKSLKLVEALKAVAMFEVVFGGALLDYRANNASLAASLTAHDESGKPLPAPGNSHDTYIDKRFLHESLSPDVLRRGLQDIFGQLLSTNVEAVNFSPESIPMPSSFHRSSVYDDAGESGHCTSSRGEGERSGIVITVEGLPKGVSVEDFLHTLVHEVAHSIDYQNVDGVSEEARIDLFYALEDLVSGDQTTVFPYVNEYEAGPHATQAQVEEEEFRQEKELFAEILQDFIRMPPLEAHDPLHRFTLQERYARRFALRHNITVQEAGRYVRVIMAVETWQQGRSDNGFFEKAQVRYANFATQLTQSRQRLLQEERQGLQEEYVRRDRALTEGMERWAYPELSTAILRAGENVPVDPDRTNVEELLFQASEVLRGRNTVTRVEHPWPERVPGMVQMHEQALNYRTAYLQSFTQSIQNSELKRMFSQLAGSGFYDGQFSSVRSSMSAVRREDRDALEHPRNVYGDDLRQNADGLYDDAFQGVRGIERILWKAEHESDASPADKQAFRTALQRFLTEETQGVWWRSFIETHPDVVRAAHELRSAP